MNFLVPQQLLEGIVQYLGNRPFVEVQQLIAGISQCPINPADQKKAEAELEKKKAAIKDKVTSIKKKVSKKAKKAT